MKDYQVTFGTGEDAVVVIEKRCSNFAELSARLMHTGWDETAITNITIIEDEPKESINDEVIKILENVVKYCENQAIFDKLGNYGDFYYKAVKWLKTQK